MAKVRTRAARRCIGSGLALLLFLFGMTGCGKNDLLWRASNGAYSPTTVKYRPDTNQAADSVETPSTTAVVEAAPAETGIGTLKGRVEFVGSFSPLPPLFAKGAATKDPSICGAEAIPNETIVVKDGGLANVFVYLEKAPKGAAVPPAGDPVAFDQKTCIFLPHAMIMRTKQPVKVLNDDAAAHNTHTYPRKNTSFNKIVSPKERAGVDLLYDQSEKEPLKVGCDIHAWMEAYHLPLDHSFAAVSADDGSFEIKDLPAGKHEFKVWHEAGKMIEKSLIVTIKPGDNEITIKVPATKLGK
jgi:hypothetical protein